MDQKYYFFNIISNILENDKEDTYLHTVSQFETPGRSVRSIEMYKKKILILGFGRIGQAVAKRCLGFDSEVLVYDPFVQKEIIENNLLINCESNFSCID